MTTIKLTAAQRRCLGNILAQGGAPSYLLTQGANYPGSLRKSVVASLERAGLVECVTDRVNRYGYPETTFYATAAGCIAFGSEVARVS